MPIYNRLFFTTPGTYRVYHPTLFGVRILGVEREGLGYTKVAGTPTNRQFQYLVSSIYFDSLIPFVTGEKVWVLYEN